MPDVDRHVRTFVDHIGRCDRASVNVFDLDDSTDCSVYDHRGSPRVPQEHTVSFGISGSLERIGVPVEGYLVTRAHTLRWRRRGGVGFTFPGGVRTYPQLFQQLQPARYLLHFRLELGGLLRLRPQLSDLILELPRVLAR